MFQHQFRTLLLAVLAACVLALSGCGGGSSTKATPPVDPVDPPPPPPMMHSVDLSGVDAEAMAGTAAIDAGMSATIG